MAAQTFNMLFQKWHHQSSITSSSLLSSISLLILLFQILMTKFSWQAQICNVLTFIITITAFFTASKTQSWLYGLWCTIVTSSAPLLIVLMTEEFFFCFLGYSFVCPLIILVLSSNQVYCLVSYFCQFIVANFHLKPLLWENLQKMNPEVFIVRIWEALSVQLFELIIAMLLVHYLKNSGAESEKVEFSTMYKKHLNSFLFEIRDALNSLHGSLQMISSNELTSDDQEMLKIAKVSTENIHRLFNNMTDSFRLDSSTPGTILNYTDSTAFFKSAWDVVSVYIKRKYQDGSIRIFGKLPKFVKIDVHRTKQMLMNLSEFLIHQKNNKRVDIQIEWLKVKMESVVDNALLQGKILKPLGENLVVEAAETETRQFLQKNIAENPGVLKLTVAGAGSLLTTEQLVAIIDYKYNFSEEVSKYNAELGLAAVAKIAKVLGGFMTADAQKDSIAFNIYIPSCYDPRDGNLL